MLSGHRILATENQHRFEACQSQQKLKLTVWAGIMGQRVIGPYFFNGNVTGECFRSFFTRTFIGSSYLQMLENYLLPSIRDLPTIQRNLMWYQHDGAPPHFSLQVRQFLDTYFAGQWMGRGGPLSWPPRSPDLTPLDFFIWGYLKQKVYINKPTTLDQLKEAISIGLNNIPQQMLINVKAGVLRRMVLCKQQNGGHFEHLK